MESIRRKIVSLLNLGSNKVCIVSLTKFSNFFFNYVNLNHFREKKENLNDQNFFNFVGEGLDKRLYGITHFIILFFII